MRLGFFHHLFDDCIFLLFWHSARWQHGIETYGAARPLPGLAYAWRKKLVEDALLSNLSHFQGMIQLRQMEHFFEEYIDIFWNEQRSILILVLIDKHSICRVFKPCNLHRIYPLDKFEMWIILWGWGSHATSKNLQRSNFWRLPEFLQCSLLS